MRHLPINSFISKTFKVILKIFGLRFKTPIYFTLPAVLRHDEPDPRSPQYFEASGVKASIVGVPQLTFAFGSLLRRQ
jgi:hypothetical protein